MNQGKDLNYKILHKVEQLSIFEGFEIVDD